MRDWQKIALAVCVALIGGLVAGYMYGASGKGALRATAERSAQELAASRARMAAGKADEDAAVGKTLRTLALLRAKEQLLRASVQLQANNFGIASQRLGSASAQLKKAKAGASASLKTGLDALMGQISQAHTLSMRLDPTVRVHLERIVELLQRIPEAR